jgi:hypothetical protein
MRFLLRYGPKLTAVRHDNDRFLINQEPLNVEQCGWTHKKVAAFCFQGENRIHKFNELPILEGLKGYHPSRKCEIWFWSEVASQPCDIEPRILLTTIGKSYIAFPTVSYSVISVHPCPKNGIWFGPKCIFFHNARYLIHIVVQLCKIDS